MSTLSPIDTEVTGQKQDVSRAVLPGRFKERPFGHGMVVTVGIPAASAFQSWPPNSKSSSLPVSNSHENTSHWI